MKKSEIVFLIAVLLLGAAMFINRGIQNKSALHVMDDEIVVITVDGDEFYKGSLYTDTELRVETGAGYNLVEISAGKVLVTEANCPGQDCVQHSSITYQGQTIVCLPHKMVITIR